MVRRADITLKPAAGITPEQARDIRARVWAFVFDCHAKKKAAADLGGEDHARKELDDSRAKNILRQ